MTAWFLVGGGRDLRVLWRLILLRVAVRRRIPPSVFRILETLERGGFEAYLVGGCVRDLLSGRTPADWDVATSAEPADITRLFPRHYFSGKRHKTVAVMTGATSVEVTTFRAAGPGAPAGELPDATLVEDLHHRDLTINAMALSPLGRLIDPSGGLRDLIRGRIRAVGSPEERFHEDPLRMMRVIRLAAQLGFSIDRPTLEGISREAPLLAGVAPERLRDELSKALISGRPAFAVELFRETGLLRQFAPELLEGVDLEQNEHHAYTVWEHLLITLENTPPELHLRLAGLLHDAAKPRCLTVEGGERHFYGHEIVGEAMAREILRRVRFDGRTIQRVASLVRNHMAIHFDPFMGDAAVRRLVTRVGRENIEDLLWLRRADRIASGTKKGDLGDGTALLLERIRKIAARDEAFGIKDLAIGGEDVMRVTGLPAGPAVGAIMKQLLAEVLEEPGRNEKAALERRAAELGGAVCREKEKP